MIKFKLESLLQALFVAALAVIAKFVAPEAAFGGVLVVGALSNYGEQFAANVLKKFYPSALAPSITNSEYEGEIKKKGDRVNVLMFLEDIELNDYVIGTDMNVQHPIDTEASFRVEKAKYYDFDIDAVDTQFTYVEDEDSTLIENAAKQLEKEVDTYVLENAYWVKAGNFVGINQLMLGDGSDTGASIATTATGGTITIDAGAATAGNDGTDENINIDGNSVSSIIYRLGFGADVVGKAIRLVSQSGYATQWWRITAASNSLAVTVENWDSSVTIQPTNRVRAADVLKGLHGPSINERDADVNPTAVAGGWGYEIQAAIPTTVTKTNIYELTVDLKTILDDNDIPAERRHINVPAYMQGLYLKASELQPDIAMYHQDVVINGKIGRCAGFDIHLATGSRCSTRAGRSTGTAASGADMVVTAGGQAYQVLANHESFITFAEKWTESRVKGAEKQFATLYQGLFLYGATVLPLRRKAAAQAFVTW